MSLLEALFLGIIQGITEFLPISSSGHLKLFQHLLGWSELKELIVFDLVCHLGTLLAIFILLRASILKVLQNRMEWRYLFVALIPLVIVYPFLSTIKEVYNRPDLLGFFFLLTACLLFIGEWSAFRRVSFQTTKSYKQSFIVGIFQVLALLPGVSRSGSTISGGRLLGWNFETALNFSFLLAIPTILGGCLVEVKELLSNPLPSTIPLSSYFVGFFSSFIVGYLCFSWLLKQKLKHPFIGFGVYSLLLGVICLIFL